MIIDKETKIQINNILNEIDGIDYIEIGNTVLNVKKTINAAETLLFDNDNGG